MEVFAAYSRYYDLLYRDKDYRAEIEFVTGLMTRHSPRAARVLELGCGTGAHAALLAERNFTVHGIDRSAEMLAGARARAARLPPAVAGRLSFAQGDVRTYRSAEDPFDAVLSLFHVVSYQPENADLIAMFKTAASSLRPGGVFVFDYWFGPAVLTDRPTARTKHMESDEIDVVRVAEPSMDAVKSLVDVTYNVTVRDKATGAVQELRETHRMRYLFPTEIALFAQIAGFTVRHSCEWLTGRAPGFDTWGVCTVLAR